MTFSCSQQQQQGQTFVNNSVTYLSTNVNTYVNKLCENELILLSVLCLLFLLTRLSTVLTSFVNIFVNNIVNNSETFVNKFVNRIWAG